MAHLVSALALVVFYMLQLTVFSQTMLLSGTTDLVFLFLIAWSLQERIENSWLWTAIAGVLVSIVSAMPFFTPLIGYLAVVGFSNLLQRRVWRVPILAMFIVTFLGTFIQHAIYIIALQINGAPISWGQSLDNVILPSVLLNLIFAIPVYAIASDLAGRVYPLEVDV
jgi:rod shape-determining protein MreD